MTKHQQAIGIATVVLALDVGGYLAFRQTSDKRACVIPESDGCPLSDACGRSPVSTLRSPGMLHPVGPHR